MADRDYFDRDRQRTWDREDRERERERARERESGDRWSDRSGSQFSSSGDWGNRRDDETHRGGEWGRESRRETWDRSQRHDQYTRGDEPERWGERSSWYGQGRGTSEHYQRGGSGSEGGYSSERSHGSSRGFTERGGGTGLRDDEDWADRNRERFGRRDYRDYRDYGQSTPGSSFANTGYGSGWGGGLSGFAGSAATYMDRGQQGRFTGRGPKGWRRSDERIREDVCERLTMHPDIDASDIDVQVREAEVTLLGVVDDRHAKRLAEEIIENISGVREVTNQIRVRRTEERRDLRDQGLGSGFDTSTGNRGETPLGLNQPGQQRPAQQPTGQYSGRPQQTGQPYSGQHSDQPATQQPQYTGAVPNNRPNR